MVVWLASAIAFFVFEDYLLLRKIYVFKDIGSDTVNSLYPQLHHLAEYLRSEGFPAWSFQQGMGQRVNAQPLGDPFNLVLMLFGSRLHFALGVVEATKLVLCAVAFTLYLGVLRAPPLTRVVGGLLYAFCGFAVIGSGWYIFSRDALYVALLLFAFEKYFRERRFLYLPLAFALVGLSQAFGLYLFVLILSGYACFRLLETGTWSASAALRLGSRVAVLAGLGVAMSAVLLTSGVLEILQSPRGAGDLSATETLWSSPVLALAGTQHNVTAVARLFANDLLGTGSAFRGWNNYLESPSFYCGLLTLLLVPQAFALGRPRQRLLYAGLLLIAIVPILFPWFRYAFWAFAGNYYRVFSLFVALALLYPALRALCWIEEGRRPDVPVLLVTVAALAGALHALGSFLPIDDEIRRMVRGFLAVETAILASMWLGRARAVTGPALLLVVCIEVAVLSHPSVNDRSAVAVGELTGRTGYGDFTVDAIHHLRERDDTFYRVSKGYSSGPSAHLSLNDSKLQGYYGTSSYHTFTLGSYVEFLEALGAVEGSREHRMRWVSGLVDLPLAETWASVKYRLEKSPKPSRFREETYRALGRFGDVWVRENLLFLPLGFTYDAYIPSERFRSRSSVFVKQAILLKAVVLDPDHPGIEVLEELDVEALPRSYLTTAYAQDVRERGEDTLDLTQYGHNLLRGAISLDRPKLLFLSIPFDPGWHARVDGVEVTPRRVNVGFTGILLEAGDHEVTLEYRVPLLRLSLGVSLAALLSYGGLVWAQRMASTSPLIRFLESGTPAARNPRL